MRIFHPNKGVFMKYVKLFIGAMLTASASVVCAANVTSAYTITLEGSDNLLTAGFKNTYTNFSTGISNLAGKTFEDTITFTLPSYNSLAANVTSTIKGVQGNGIKLTSLSLYEGGSLVATGVASTSATGVSSLADLLYEGLEPAGTYKLVVDGKFLGKGGGSYGGTVSVTPVPEPETWGLTVSGLAAVGLMVRRRKAHAKSRQGLRKRLSQLGLLRWAGPLPAVNG
jgi:hypothetical protein